MPYNAMLVYIISMYTLYFIVSLLLHLQGLQRAYFCTSLTITARRRGPGLMYFSFTPIPLPPNLTTFPKREDHTRAGGHGACDDIVDDPRLGGRRTLVAHKGQKGFRFPNPSSRGLDISARI